TSAQLKGLADIAEEWGGGYADITTRSNIQIREIQPRNIIKVLTRLQELGLTARGSGVDNIRNITASPTAGIDLTELIDTRPFAKALHHYILNHRDLYGLPRKFNVAFDGGGAVSVVAETNDIAFIAVKIGEPCASSPDLIRPDPASEAVLRRADACPGSTPNRPSESENRDCPEPGIYFRVELAGITGHKQFATDT